MKLIYEEYPNYQFPYWICGTIGAPLENMMSIMDINQWSGDTFGELGVRWGYERISDTSRSPGPQTNPVRVRLFFTDIHFFWRFKEKSDAIAFKLRWDNL